MFFKISSATIILLAIAVAAFVSCGSPHEDKTAIKDTAVAVAAPTANADTTLPSTADDDTLNYATYYLVIVDTGQNYYPLRDKMYALNHTLNWPIDTMGRYYNVKKNEIVLPDDDEDEIYRGEYFPRRSPSAFLSMEYYNVYSEHTTSSNIALVANICETKATADSSLAVFKPQCGHAFVLKARVYVGCMH